MVNAGINGVHFPAYDLNGNVMGLVNATNGIISAKYEYGPFGEVFCSVGDMAEVNPFGFSTKYTDNETDLVYYGYRYYSPALGRWLSRDPIEERGGLNLYGFVYNNPVYYVDDSGSKPFPQEDYTYSPGKLIDTPSGYLDNIFSQPPANPNIQKYLYSHANSSYKPTVGFRHNFTTPVVKPPRVTRVASGVGKIIELSSSARESGFLRLAYNRHIKRGTQDCLKEARRSGSFCGCCEIQLYEVWTPSMISWDYSKSVHYGSSKYHEGVYCSLLKIENDKRESEPAYHPFYGLTDSSFQFYKIEYIEINDFNKKL